MSGLKYARAVCGHNARFPGPTMEHVDGKWRLSDPLILTGSDRLRILSTWFGGLDPVDSELLFRIIERNSETV